MGLRKSLTVLTMGAALAAPGVVAAAAPSSAASPQHARLSISRSFAHPGYNLAVVSGHFNTTRAQTTVGMRLKGDGSIFDDDLGVSRTGQAWYGDFSLYALVWHGTLNGDWEGRDEIFANVSSSPGWKKSTNNVDGYF